jgi:hypothetical protein
VGMSALATKQPRHFFGDGNRGASGAGRSLHSRLRGNDDCG